MQACIHTITSNYNLQRFGKNVTPLVFNCAFAYGFLPVLGFVPDVNQLITTLSISFCEYSEVSQSLGDVLCNLLFEKLYKNECFPDVFALYS